MIHFASLPNVQNSMVCAHHKFKKACCKCHRVGRFHETFKSSRSRGAHKENLHTMLTSQCVANNSKYAHQRPLHIHAFCLSIVYLCNCIRVFSHEWMQPGCPLLNLSILPRRANFSFSLDAHFSTQDSSHR